MPLVPSLAVHFEQETAYAPPNAEDFISVPLSYSGTRTLFGEETIDALSNIVALPELQNFSIEELRLQYGWYQTKEEDEALGISSIPSAVPRNVAVETTKIQFLLLEVLVLAEKYKWEKLFNRAMDANLE